MKHITTHEEQLVFLKRIEGQIRGIQKMIEERKYCVDIVLQIYAVIGALHRVGEKMFIKHIEHCVVDALRGKSEHQKQQKISEVMEIIKRMRKLK